MSGWTVDIGRYRGGERMVLPVPGWNGAHWLLGGSSNCGKSSLMSVTIARLVLDYGDQVAIVVVDPHMVGFQAWEPRCSLISYGWHNAPRGLELVRAEMKRRIMVMFRHNIKQWSPDKAHLIGPYLVVFVDEVAAVTMAPKTPGPKPAGAPLSAEASLISLAQELRKAGGGLVLGAQSPQAKIISSPILQQCPIRWCGRTRTPEQTEAILETRRFPAHDPTHPDGITIDEPGGCFVDDGYQIRRGRTMGIRQQDEERFVATTQGDKADLGWEHLWPFDLDDDSNVTPLPAKGRRSASAGR